ncbi:MAG: NarK/NasA family nitrate transporter [Planctomycetes bacterium]|nr:NarK/NasA family nitrate transporter [Planctomycetota bacterium]
MNDARTAWLVLFLNTLAFTVCFAVWTMNGVLVTHLVTTGAFDWTPLQTGVLMATPVLTGSVLRLPVGYLTDRHGGKPVYLGVMIASALALVGNSFADGFWSFFLAALGFGIAGASFAVGIAYTSLWFPRERQGTALGIFGAGNAGSAVTLLVAPRLLTAFTDHGADPEGWRKLPLVYAAGLVLTCVVLFLLARNKRPEQAANRTFASSLAPLKVARVWRFGAYYFLVFGAFVALSQWLVPYYVKFYEMPLATAGVLASIFSLPSGLIRALGGWLSDVFGARRVMYWVLGTSTIGCALLVFPRMSLLSPGEGVLAGADSTIASIDAGRMTLRARTTGKESVVVLSGERPASIDTLEGAQTEWAQMRVLPVVESWQEWAEKVEADGSRRAFAVGDQVRRRELLAVGRTHISFQANVYVFTFLVFLIGIVWGVGKAAVYKHIPEYFPGHVGVVGGLVGVIGGLGGFVCPILFGQMLSWTGLWTSCWVFLAVFSFGCLVWMHRIVQRMTREHMPELHTHIESEVATRARSGS